MPSWITWDRGESRKEDGGEEKVKEGGVGGGESRRPAGVKDSSQSLF